MNIIKFKDPQTSAPTARSRPRPEARLARQVQVIDLKIEAGALRAEPPWKAHGHNSKTLIRRSDSRVVLLTMMADIRSPQHAHLASSTIQVAHGTVRVRLPSQVVELSEGMMLSIVKQTPHDIEAMTDCTLVLTFAMPAAK